ncbi:MAG: hypothetical protein WC781_00265 [Candidatus Pacearchaeota archaeon]
MKHIKEISREKSIVRNSSEIDNQRLEREIGHRGLIAEEGERQYNFFYRATMGIGTGFGFVGDALNYCKSQISREYLSIERNRY